MLRLTRLPKPRNDPFLANVVFAMCFLFPYRRQEPCGVSGFSYIFIPPPSLQAHALDLERVCVQAHVLAGAISCKCKHLQGRFRASASACKGDFVQAQALARSRMCLHKPPRPPAFENGRTWPNPSRTMSGVCASYPDIGSDPDVVDVLMFSGPSWPPGARVCTSP